MITKESFRGQIVSDINTFSGAYSEEKKGLASDMFNVGMKWAETKSLPPKHNRKKLRLEYKKQCRDYLVSNYSPKAYGSLTGIAFWFIFRWVLSWVVKKIIDEYLLEI